MKHALNRLEIILMFSLLVSLVCSIIICIEVYVYKNGHYTKGFSTWQMPMIFAILADMYLLE